jgi:glycerol kinase
MTQYVLAIDLGTTGNRAILFDRDGQLHGQAYKELTQYYPHPGWLEHDVNDIWSETLSTIAWTTADKTYYALEGAMFTTGACIQWLRDGAKLIESAPETEAIAQSVPDTDGVYRKIGSKTPWF